LELLGLTFPEWKGLGIGFRQVKEQERVPKGSWRSHLKRLVGLVGTEAKFGIPRKFLFNNLGVGPCFFFLGGGERWTPEALDCLGGVGAHKQRGKPEGIYRGELWVGKSGKGVIKGLGKLCENFPGEFLGH